MGTKTITMKHAIYGDIVLEAVHVREDGKAVYLMRDAIPFRAFSEASCNDYAKSDIKQWLNSDAPAGKWWTDPAGKGKLPRYWDAPGFLAGFAKEDLERITETELGLFFLPSYTELTGEPNGNLGMEGEQWTAFEGMLYGELAERLRKKELGTGDKAWWWLRSCHPSYPRRARSVNTDGHPYDNIWACYPFYAAAAACVIG